jgi:hypothetical protein
MFYDTASTTLLASTVYRVSVLWNDHSHLPNAEKCRKALFAASNSSTSTSSPAAARLAVRSATSASAKSSSASASAEPSATSPAGASASASATTVPLTGLKHFTSDGWLTPVVDPHQFGVEGKNSPEGEAFVLELQAAYNEWVAGGSVGANAASRTISSAAGCAWVVGCIVLGNLLAYA